MTGCGAADNPPKAAFQLAAAKKTKPKPKGKPRSPPPAASASAVPTPTSTAIPTTTATAAPTPTAIPTTTATATPAPSPTATATASPTSPASPIATPSPTVTPPAGAAKDAAGRPLPDTAAKRAEEFPLPLATIEVGYAYGDRWFRQTEPTTGEIRTYTAVRLHSVVAVLEVYPASLSGLASWKNLGLTLSYGQALGVNSRLAGQTTEAGQSSNNVNSSAQTTGPFPTTYRRWDAGVRYRFPVASEGAWRFGVGAGYRQWRFDFDIPDEGNREVPRADYSLVRVSGDVEKWFGHFGMRGGLGLMAMLAPATLGNRESESLAWGGEANLGAAYALLPYLRLRASLFYTLYHLSLAPLPGRADAPGSVWDHYLTPSVSAEGVF